MKNVIAAVVAVVALGSIGFLAYSGSSDGGSKSESNQSASDQTINQQTNTNELDPNDYTKGAQIGEALDATSQTQVSIDIDDFIFKTTYLKVKKGTTVTWTNQGRIRHDVTSATSSPKAGLASDLLNKGDSYSYTFDEVGLYEYFCSPHPTQMRATVLVVE